MFLSQVALIIPAVFYNLRSFPSVASFFVVVVILASNSHLPLITMISSI